MGEVLNVKFDSLLIPQVSQAICSYQPSMFHVQRFEPLSPSLEPEQFGGTSQLWVLAPAHWKDAKIQQDEVGHEKLIVTCCEARRMLDIRTWWEIH